VTAFHENGLLAHTWSDSCGEPKDQVASATREDRSLMPSNYGRLFNARELDDLVAYLAGLGGEK
jgi:hypothetical protein